MSAKLLTYYTSICQSPCWVPPLFVGFTFSYSIADNHSSSPSSNYPSLDDLWVPCDFDIQNSTFLPKTSSGSFLRSMCPHHLSRAQYNPVNKTTLMKQLPTTRGNATAPTEHRVQPPQILTTCSLRHILISSSHVPLGLQSGYFPKNFPSNILNATFVRFVLHVQSNIISLILQSYWVRFINYEVTLYVTFFTVYVRHLPWDLIFSLFCFQSLASRDSSVA